MTSMRDPSTLTRPHSHAGDDNPVRGRFNSWFLGLLEGYVERRQADVRADVFGQADGVVADIGAGNGPTFRHLDPGTTVHAIEPNPHFHERLDEAAEHHSLDLHVHARPGEATGLPDDSVDTAITSWVLCTVGDPDAVVAEVRRILKPGGRFLFLEHVAAPPRTAVGRVQWAVYKPWRWLFEGCEVTRDTAATIRAAGFSTVHIEPSPMPTVFVPMRPQIAGVAIN